MELYGSKGKDLDHLTKLTGFTDTIPPLVDLGCFPFRDVFIGESWKSKMSPVASIVFSASSTPILENTAPYKSIAITVEME